MSLFYSCAEEKQLLYSYGTLDGYRMNLMHCSNSPDLTKQFNNISRCTSVLASLCLEALT